jgi:glycosyltransferase involved in cell wall biosynthesis
VVSVIMTSYNRGNIISRAIDSVIQQTYDNWQHLVIDDCGKDNTEEVIMEQKVRLYENI